MSSLLPVSPTEERSTPLMRKNSLSRWQWPAYTLLLLVSDSVMLALAFWLAFQVRFRLHILPFQQNVFTSSTYYFRLSMLSTVMWLSIFALNGLYQRANLLGGFQEYALVFHSVTLGCLLTVVAGFLTPTLMIARGWLLTVWLTAFLSVGGARFWLRRVVYALRRRGYFLSPALIVGLNEEGRLLAEQLQQLRLSGWQVLGYLDNATGQTIETAPVKRLGTPDDLEEMIRKYNITEIILTTSALRRTEVVRIFERYGFSSQVNLHLSSGLFELLTTGVQVREVAGVPLVQVNKVRMTGFDRLLKATLDYGLTLIILALIWPVLILIALLVRLDSPGPVIYRRRVMGLHGCRFDAFKFRTMYINSDEILEQYPELKKELAKNHKLKHDPRITRLGHILRKFSLDELPQLFNVLRGEMSLVGPRMISPVEMAQYGQWGMNLLTVKPGITGLWQVSGRSDVSYTDRVRLDMYYIRNWTIWLDIQILFQTIPAVIRAKGAY